MALRFQVGVFFGGLAIAKDEATLKSNCPNIVVGTPGRILALIRSKKLSLKNLKHFILDECDKMLEQLGTFYVLTVESSFISDDTTDRDIWKLWLFIFYSENFKPIQPRFFEATKSSIFSFSFSDMRRDVQEIFRNTPHEKQVMMFSATLSKEIRPVCKKFMQDVGKIQTPILTT